MENKEQKEQKELKEKINKAKKMMDSEDIKIDDLAINMTLTEFKKELLRLNQLGRELTLKHREKMPMAKDKDGNIPEGSHAPATDPENCEICKSIIDTHRSFMELQAKTFGITGLTFNSLMAAVKITEGVLKMIENENKKEAKNE